MHALTQRPRTVPARQAFQVPSRPSSYGGSGGPEGPDHFDGGLNTGHFDGSATKGPDLGGHQHRPDGAGRGSTCLQVVRVPASERSLLRPEKTAPFCPDRLKVHATWCGPALLPLAYPAQPCPRISPPPCSYPGPVLIVHEEVEHAARQEAVLAEWVRSTRRTKLRRRRASRRLPARRRWPAVRVAPKRPRRTSLDEPIRLLNGASASESNRCNKGTQGAPGRAVGPGIGLRPHCTHMEL